MQGLRNFLPLIYEWGYRNEVVCLDDPREEFVGKDPFIVHVLGPCKRPWAYAPKLLPWLKKNVQRFDAILIHGLWLYHSYAVHETIKWLREQGEGQMPVVAVVPHGMLDPYFQKAPDRKLKALRNNLYWKLIEGKVVNRSTAILFTCEEELRLARATFSTYRPQKEINIGYGIAEPPLFTTAMAEQFAQVCPEVQGKPFLLFLSRIHPKKGVDLLLKAYADVRNSSAAAAKEFSGLPELVIAGPGMETAYGQQLRKLVHELGLSNCVYFPGMLSGDAKWGAFYSCEAFILPSHQENFGIAVAEALACRKPVLISNQVNIWREIQNSNAGLIAEDTVSGAIKLLIQWSVLTPAEKRKIENAARTCYEAHFAVASAARRMIRVILKMIAANTIRA